MLMRHSFSPLIDAIENLVNHLIERIELLFIHSRLLEISPFNSFIKLDQTLNLGQNIHVLFGQNFRKTTPFINGMNYCIIYTTSRITIVRLLVEESLLSIIEGIDVKFKGIFEWLFSTNIIY